MIKRFQKMHRQSGGFSEVELIISAALSLIVTLSMITLMGSSLSNTARIIKMTRLTDDLRMSMQLMTRDVRRSNFTANAINCFANPDCVTDGSLSTAGDVEINQTNDCFAFNADRDHDGDATEAVPGAFRWMNADGLGVIQMWVGDTQPNCSASDSNWVPITDPAIIVVTAFSVDDSDSYDEVIRVDPDGTLYTQRVRKLQFSVSARLADDETIQRTVADGIKLRNNLYL